MTTKEKIDFILKSGLTPMTETDLQDCNLYRLDDIFKTAKKYQEKGKIDFIPVGSKVIISDEYLDKYRKMEYSNIFVEVIPNGEMTPLTTHVNVDIPVNFDGGFNVPILEIVEVEAKDKSLPNFLTADRLSDTVEYQRYLLDGKEEGTQHKGLRFNDGKLRYDLVHPQAHEEMVKVLTVGANKYAPRNWEKGMAWSTVLASLKRHIAAFEKGEDVDPETGLLHMAHAACNIHFLTAYYHLYPQGDDRQHKYLSGIKVGLDIDEVIADWVGSYTEKFGMVTPEFWNFDTHIKEKFEQLDDEFWLSIKPKINPKDLPFEPHCYITSRPIPTALTERWIAENGFPTMPVYTVGVGESKVEVAKKAGIDIFVDDRFDNFVELNNAGICTYLMDAPHNQRYEVGYKRLYNLKDLKL